MTEDKKSRGWVFTLNITENFVAEQFLIDCLNVSCAKSWVFQMERGHEGNLHYQGQVYFENPRTFGGMKQIMYHAHWEHMRDCASSIKYVTKQDDTFVKGPWAKGISVQYRETGLFVLSPWQETVYNNLLERADDRHIHWFTDKKGGAGKTAFAKHLIETMDALYVSGKANDVKHAVAEWRTAGRQLKVVIFDFPRTCEGFVSFDAIESIKNGILFSGKYNSTQVTFPSPHLLIFANFEPELSKLSKDRWVLYNLDELVPEEQRFVSTVAPKRLL